MRNSLKRRRIRKQSRPSRAFALWRADWKGGHTPWVNDKVHEPFMALLKKRSLAEPGSAVLVPLCGNSPVIRALYDRGYDVTGVEYVPEAVTSLKKLFPRMRWSRTGKGSTVRFSRKGVEILQQDFLTFRQETRFACVYDRAAFIAINPRHRRAYARILMKSLLPGGYIYLVGFEATGAQPKGPPFAVSPREIRSLFKGMKIWQVRVKTVRKLDPRFAAAGVKSLKYTSYLLQRI